MSFNYPEPEPRPKGLRFLSYFGPGAILASATIGAGETILAVRAGAWGEYNLLWLIFLAVITKSFFLLYFLGRYSAISGDNIAQRLKQFPGPSGWLLLFILLADLIPAGPVFAAIAAPCGRLIWNIIGIGNPSVYALIFALVAIVIAVIQKYDFLEKQQVVVCLILLACVSASTLIIGMNWRALFVGLFSFGKIPEIPVWAQSDFANRPVLLELATVFGYAGNIAMGYIVYAEFIREKRWGVFRSDVSAPEPEKLPTDAENLERARKGLWPVWGDLAVTSILIFFVTGAFLVAGAVILYPAGTMPRGFDLLSKQASIFSAISPMLVPIYYIAILFALWGTLNSLPEIYTKVTYTFLKALSPKLFANLSEKFLMRLLGIYFALCSIVLIVFNVKPAVMMDFVGLFSTNLGVTAAMAGALWLDHKLPPKLRAPTIMFAAGILSFAILIFFSILSAVQYFS